MSEKNLNFPPIENGAPEHEMPIKQVQSIYSPNQPSACNDVGTKLIQVSHSKEVSSISFYALICTIVSPHYKSSHLWLFHNDPI